MRQSRRYLPFILLLALTLPALGETPSSTSKKSIVIPAGTRIAVRINENLSSETAQEGDTFTGVLAEPIDVNGETVFPQGADVAGTITAAHKSGRLSDPGVLELTLNSITSGSRTLHPNAEPYSIKGESHTKSNVTKIGGGAAAGAIIGAIAGGGKGAAIGAGVGAAAGTGIAAATGKKDAKVESEAVLEWTTAEDTATSRASSGGNAAASPRRSYNENDSDEKAPAASSSFSAHDRRVIRDCFDDHASELPPGLARRESLPPGLERQVERNGTLPPGLQKRVVPLPEVCDRQLPKLPASISRVVLGQHVMLIDQDYTVLDLFNLDE
jgi:hypothetical protein